MIGEGHDPGLIAKRKEHEAKMEQFKIRRQDFEIRKKTFIARAKDLKAEAEKYVENNLSTQIKDDRTQLKAENEQISREYKALQERNDQGKITESDFSLRKTEFEARIKAYNDKKGDFQIRRKAENEQLREQFKTQFYADRDKLHAEDLSLKAEENVLKAEKDSLSTKVTPPIIEPPARTFVKQAPSPTASIVTQTGFTLKDLTDYLGKHANVNKINQHAKSKFMHVDKSIHDATPGEIKLELIGQSGEKTTVHIREGKDASGHDTLSFNINKESQDDFESIKSICHLAVFSAAEQNKPTDFKVNENHPHRDKIKEYLSAAIQELAPEVASQYKVNGITFDQHPQKSPSAGTG